MIAALVAGAVFACAMRARAPARWPAWSAALFGVALLAARAWELGSWPSPPWRSFADALPWSGLMWGAAALAPARLLPLVLALPALLLSRSGFSEAAERWDWGAAGAMALTSLSVVVAVGSALLARAAARAHPAPAPLGAWTLIAGAAAAVAAFGGSAAALDADGTLALALAPVLLLAATRGHTEDVSALAPAVTGTVHAALLYGLLRGEVLWISCVMLLLLAPAAGLITLRTKDVARRVAGVAFVTLLPAAAAVVLAWFLAELRAPTGLAH